MKITFDRIKDDPCYGCKHAVLKDIDRCTIFERLYLCKNRKILEREIELLKSLAKKLDSNASLKEVEKCLSGINLASNNISYMLDESNLSQNEFFAEPKIICIYKDEEQK